MSEHEYIGEMLVYNLSEYDLKALHEYIKDRVKGDLRRMYFLGKADLDASEQNAIIGAKADWVATDIIQEIVSPKVT